MPVTTQNRKPWNPKVEIHLGEPTRPNNTKRLQETAIYTAAVMILYGKICFRRARNKKAALLRREIVRNCVT